MDLGIYTNSLAISEETEKIINSINGGIDEGVLNSASMFVWNCLTTSIMWFIT